MSLMRAEALEAPQAVARLLAQDEALYAALARQLRDDPPAAVLTVARGSSDHAAQYFGYLVMARLGRLVTSLPMSLVTLVPARLQRQGVLAVALSQSGRSPDLVAPMAYFSEGGARTVALVNEVDSPLAAAARWVLPLHAGPEHSVAATKSFIAQMVAGARLVAAWQDDPALRAALAALPAALDAAAQVEWPAAIAGLQGADRLYVIGRGTGLSVALEAALKLKEVCGLQAEAFSGAELRHGPMALVETGYPVLVLAPAGPALPGLLQLAQDLRQRGARVLLAAPVGTADAELPLAAVPHEDLGPIAAVQSFYGMVEALARARGADPDRPRHLSKVTLTR